MTIDKLLSQMGIGTKHIAERYSDYAGTQAHEPHMYNPYEPHAHMHHTTSKHTFYHGGGKKNHAAMSALTLLAFLFFLHILQQCLREHMQTMANPQIMVMTAGREGEQKMPENNKLDKSGTTVKSKERNKVKNNTSRAENSAKVAMTKIKTAQHTPKMDPINYGHFYQEYRQSFPGHLSVDGD